MRVAWAYNVPNMFNRSKRYLVVTALCVCAVPVYAGVTRVVIEQRESPAFKGQVFGKAGQYELLSGHFFGELNPADPHNMIVNDLQLAPRNARGMVEYTGTFSIAKPVDMSKASSVMVYSVANRGNGAAAGSNDGHVSVVSGWQGDVLPRGPLQTLQVPVATNADGSPVTGPVLSRFINSPAGYQYAFTGECRERPGVSASGYARYFEGHAAAAGFGRCSEHRDCGRRLGVCRLHEDSIPRDG